MLGVVGGGLAFALFFEGLALAASPSSAVLQKTLFLWVAIAAWPLLGERPGAASLLALVVLLGGTLLLDPPAGTGLGVGELLILAATLLWTGETILARRLLPRVGAGRGAAARMAIGSIVLLAIVAVSGGLAGIGAWTPAMWGFVAITAVLLAGYVAAWYGALERAPAAVVTSVLVVGALITAALRTVAAGTPPTDQRLAGLVLLAAGAGVVAVVSLRRTARIAVASETPELDHEPSASRCRSIDVTVVRAGPSERRARVDGSGALAFARFAFRPNALGYCGGQAPGELFDRVVAGADDPDLHRLCGEFAGARPYLELLAQAPGAQGPLDPQVVEAYWVGGPLLEALSPRAFQADLERRVRPRATAGRLALAGGQARAGRRAAPRLPRPGDLPAPRPDRRRLARRRSWRPWSAASCGPPG